MKKPVASFISILRQIAIRDVIVGGLSVAYCCVPACLADNAGPSLRAGSPWPESASESGATLPEILQRLSSEEFVVSDGGTRVPSTWQGIAQHPLPGGHGWIGTQSDGHLVIRRTDRNDAGPVIADAVAKLPRSPSRSSIEGVALFNGRQCAVVIDRMEEKRGAGSIPAGIRLKLLDLERGSLLAERVLETGTRVCIAPSGTRLLLLMPVAPTEALILTESSGSPPADEGTRRLAASAVRMIRPENLQEETPFTAHLGVGCTDAGFSPDESFIWTNSEQGGVRIFSASTCRRTGPVWHFPAGARFAITNDGQLIAGMFGTLSVYDGTTGKSIASQTCAHARAITAIAVHPSGHSVASYGCDGMLRAWQLPDLTPLGSWDAAEPVDGGRIWFSDNCVLVASATEYATSQPPPTYLLQWDPAPETDRLNLPTDGAITRMIAMSPAGGLFARVDSAQTISFYDNRTSQRLATLPSPVKECWALRLPWERAFAAVAPYEGKWEWAAQNEQPSDAGEFGKLTLGPSKKWMAITANTSRGRFASSSYLDWICTFSGREMRGGQAGFPKGTSQPQGWLEVPGTEWLIALGWNWALVYSPEQQRIVHAYQFRSRVVHATYDASNHTFIVAHGDGTLRRWTLPDSLFK